MNFRELLNKLDEADAAADPARAQYDKFKADDAKTAAIEQVKKLTQPQGSGNFIDPKDGIIKWQEQNGMGGAGGIREFPFDWYQKGQEGQFFEILKAAGLEIVPVERKNMFGSSQVAGIKGGPQALNTLGQAQAQGAVDDQGKAMALEKLKQLQALIAKLKAGGKPVQEAIDAEIAKQLMESFGYTQEQLDELSMQDVGDFGRGMWHGATLGAGSNLAAGAKSLVKGTKYKDELEKELSADKAAAERSPWAYNAGDIGGAIGSSFVIPGAGVGNLAARGAAKLGGGTLAQGLARGAGQIGANLAIQKGVDTALDAHNKDVLGKQGQAGAKPGATDPKLAQLQKIIGAKADGIMGPETKQKLTAWQQSQGIAADGVPGPETYGKAGIKENVAETMSSLRAKLAMLEAEQQTDEGIWDTAVNAGSKLVKGIGQGFKNPGIRNLPNLSTAQRVGANIGTAGNKVAGAATAAGSKVAGAAKTAGGAIARNPGKTALGTAALGYGLSQLGPDGTPVQPNKPTGKPNTSGQAGSDTGATQLDQATLDQINQLMSELSQFDFTEIQQGLVQARQDLSKITGDKNIGSADKPQASNATANTTVGPNMGQVNTPAPVVQATGDAAKDDAARQAGNVVQYK